MMTGLGLERQRASYRSLTAVTSRPEDDEKLRKLRTFKHHRRAGHEVKPLLKRLHTTRESLKKWAKELNFDLGGTL